LPRGAQIARINAVENTMPTTKRNQRIKVLAAASGGGHWIELMRIIPAFAGHTVAYVTVRRDYRADVGDAPFYTVNDATGWHLRGLMELAVRMFIVILRVRPDVVVSTGAAPGYFAVRFGRLLGARTIWVDSLANVEQLSRAGQMAGRYAHLWLTQWPVLAREDGPRFAGQVI
jgi:UDP-N-acetylglucosamine:LPS N-acetylglucosamine transferase